MANELSDPPTPMSEASQDNADANIINSVSQASERLSNTAERDYAYATPDRQTGNKYDEITLTRDMILGNIPATEYKWYDTLLDLYLTTIQDFEYAGYTGMAMVYRNEMVGLIDRLRSRDGFERIQQNSVNATLNKGKGANLSTASIYSLNNQR